MVESISAQMTIFTSGICVFYRSQILAQVTQVNVFVVQNRIFFIPCREKSIKDLSTLHMCSMEALVTSHRSCFHRYEMHSTACSVRNSLISESGNVIAAINI